jgi:O-antigen/teichoic acid export membrane protein
MSRTRNSAWNMAGGLLFTGVSVACGLLATPWLLRWLGAERFGAFKVLTDWVGYLTLLDLGLGGALLAGLASGVGAGDDDAVRGVLASGRRAYFGVAALTLAVGLLLVVVLPFVLHAPHLAVGELRAAALVALVPVLMTPLLVFRALAEARQRTYLLNLLMTGQAILTTLLCLATARAGWGLVGQSLAAALAQAPAILALAYDGKRAFGKIGLPHAAFDARSVLASLRWPSWIHSLADRVGLVSDSVIIAWLLGPMSVTPFFLTQQLPMLMQFLLRGLSNATWAGLVELHTQGQHAVFRQRLLELTGLICGLGVAVLGPVAAYNHHFVRQWVGASADAGEIVTVLACANAWLWALFSLWSWPILGAGHIGRWAPYSAAFILVNVPMSVFATHLCGLPGPLIGSSTGFLLIDAWAMPRVLNRVFALSPTGLWRAALTPLWWGLPYAGAMWYLAHNHRPAGWAALGAEMAAATLGGLALWGRLGVSRELRSKWQSQLQQSMRRR